MRSRIFITIAIRIHAIDVSGIDAIRLQLRNRNRPGHAIAAHHAIHGGLIKIVTARLEKALEPVLRVVISGGHQNHATGVRAP